MKLPAIVKLKKYIASTYIFSIVICKFCHGQEPCPVVLLSINKNTKINLYCAILLHGLAVRLQIEYSGDLLLNVKKVA